MRKREKSSPKCPAKGSQRWCPLRRLTEEPVAGAKTQSCRAQGSHYREADPWESRDMAGGEPGVVPTGSKTASERRVQAKGAEGTAGNMDNVCPFPMGCP